MMRSLTLVLGLALAALAVRLCGLDEALQYDRAAIAAGQWWRILTCHCAHWSDEMLLWDAGAFALLAFLCERAGRRKFIICLFAAAIAIPGALWIVHPDMHLYRGLSGIDSALFGVVAARLLQERWREGDAAAAGVVTVLLAAFVCKLAVEAATGQCFFVGDTGAAAPTPVAHLAGGVLGALFGVRRFIAREELRAACTR